MNLRKYFTKEVRIGLVGVVSLFLLIYGINYLKGIRLFHPTTYYYVKYTNINGLSKSSPVFADGYKVGLVSDIIYDYKNPGNVFVEIELDVDMRLPKGTTAELETDMLGGIKVNLLLVNNLRERYEVGDTIVGVASTGMMAKVADIMPQVEQMLPKLDSILTSLNKMLADENIPATLESVKNITANLDKASVQFNVMMSRDVPRLTNKLNTISDNFIAITDNLKDFDYASTLGQVEETVSSVKMFTDKLCSPEGTVGLLMNDTQLYDNLSAATFNAANLLEDLQKHPKRYVHFSLFGKKNK